MLRKDHRLAGAYKNARAKDGCRKKFAALWKVYSRSSKGGNVVCLPADLVAAIQAAKESQHMYQDSPALLAICLRGKDDPFKTVLRQEWMRRSSGVQAGSSVDPQAHLHMLAEGSS